MSFDYIYLFANNARIRVASIVAKHTSDFLSIRIRSTCPIASYVAVLVFYESLFQNKFKIVYIN